MDAPTITAGVLELPHAIDCWNRVGVRGDRSCERLAEHVHCRNCPVFSAGARALLDRPLAEAQSADRTLQVAAPRPHVRERGRSIVIFSLGADCLALPTATIVEVASERPVHSLPNRRDRVVLGIVNVRGQLLTCVSLERVLGLPGDAGRERGQDPMTSGDDGPSGLADVRTRLRRLLVFQHARLRLVAHVDQVHGVHDVAPNDLAAVPDTIATPMAAYSKALILWQDRSVGLLDADLVFDAVRKSLS